MNNDGGPAFPCHGSMGEVTWNGMTLRDYFAAQAMTSLLLCSVAPGTDAPQAIAAAGGVGPYSYGIADAMLKARAA